MISVNKLENGLVLILEEIPESESITFDLFLAGGTIYDPENLLGASLILPELTSRGAGNRNSIQLSEAFDDLGIRHGEGAGSDHVSYHANFLPEHLKPALDLVFDMVLSPSLPETEIGNIVEVLKQDLEGLKDDPARQVFVKLSERYFPKPFSRNNYGTIEGLENVTRDDLLSLWKNWYRPAACVISIAGKVDSKSVATILDDLRANNLFSSWHGAGPEKPKFTKCSQPSYHHEASDSAQTQIALAFPSVPFGDPSYYAVRVLMGVLSGGMFGRLFIEVREKKGLCYSVYSKYSANSDTGNIFLYAGTTPERAQETFDVSCAVLDGLYNSITEEELTRVKANILSGLIIGEESVASRAGSNALDWWLGKRIRSLTEIKDEINKVSIADINKYLEKYPLKNPMCVTLGNKELRVNYA